MAVDELSQLARPDELVLVGQGEPSDADGFFEGRFAEARVVSDTDRKLFTAFGLRRGTLGQLLAPAALVAAWRHRKHGVGKPVGDPLVMPGAFVVAGAAVLYAHRGQHAADNPNWSDVLAVVRAASS